ncbi:MAG: SurA N-terminal domain-containing protein [Marinobacter sp.]|nr:SurA N-terminal domain-containing protein [Marinobacter sp.]
MKSTILILYVGIFLVLTGCMQAEDLSNLQSEEKTTDADVFATVNGTPLGKNLYHFLLGSREQESQQRLAYDDGFDIQQHRQQVANDLIMTELLAQQATRIGMHETELVQLEMAMAEKTLLAQLYVQKLMAAIEVDDSEIRHFYDQQSEQAIYRFMIWQTPDQGRAVEMLNTLKTGSGEGITSEVIETPWLRDVDISPEVNEIVRQLGVNEFVESPIFQDGVWKVVQVIDKQVMVQGSYEEERELIKAELVRLKLEEKLEELAAGALVVFNDQETHPLTM